MWTTWQFCVKYFKEIMNRRIEDGLKTLQLWCTLDERKWKANGLRRLLLIWDRWLVSKWRCTSTYPMEWAWRWRRSDGWTTLHWAGLSVSRSFSTGGWLCGNRWEQHNALIYIYFFGESLIFVEQSNLVMITRKWEKFILHIYSNGKNIYQV